MKKTLLVVLALVVALPVSGFAWEKERGPNWVNDSVFADTLDDGTVLVRGAHGIVVDKYDRIWIGSYYASYTGGIVVLNPDGTPAAISPVASVAFADTTFTLNVDNACRGMNVDADGNILYCHRSALIRLNVDTGAGMNYWIHPALASLTKPAVDGDGYIYVGKVVGTGPVSVIDPATFELTQEITLNPAAGYTRGIEISPDAKTLVGGNLTTGGPVYIYTSEDYVTYTLSDSLYLDVLGNNIFEFQLVTMDWDRDGKLWISHDNAYGTAGDTHNGYVVVDMDSKEFSYFFMPLDSTEFNGTRGIAFNTTGDVGYAASFTGNRVYKITKAELLPAGTWTFDDGITNFHYKEVFADTLDDGTVLVRGGHGIVVDKYDRIWIGSYYASYTGGIVVLNPDGTPATISPVASVAFTDTTFTLNVDNACRGMNVDADGNILYCHRSALIRLNVDTGAGMNYWIHPALASLTKPAVDGDGYIYVGKVVGTGPVSVIDPATFELTQEITLNPAAGYTRGIEISPDAKTIVGGNLTTGGPVYIYTSEDYVTYTLTDSLFTDSEGYPVFLFQLVTMDWDRDGNLWISHDDAYGTGGNVENGFVIVDIANHAYDWLAMPLDSTEFNGTRGVAFNTTGDTAYAVSFTANKVWKFGLTPTSVKTNPVAVVVPTDFQLAQNYPNPFNPTTTIPFSLKKSSMVELKVYDILGREVKTLVKQQMAPGTYRHIFDGAGLASGVYHYRLNVNGTMMTKRMLLIK